MKPVAHVINLDRRPDRWQRTQDLWSPFFRLVRVPAIDMPNDGARGCKMSHVQYADRALAVDTMAIILEDDCIPTSNMSAIGMECIAEARKHLCEWDCANLSPLLDLSGIGVASGLTFSPAHLFRTESPLFLRCSYSHSTNFVLYNHRTLPILQASLASRLPIDMYLARECQSQWTPVRLLATQSFEDSDIRKPFPEQAKWYARSAEMLNQFPTVKNGILVHHSEHKITSDDVKKMEDE